MRISSSPETGKSVPSPRRVKQAAKQIRLQMPTTRHLQALDLAAQARGWSSYKALERDWKSNRISQVVHVVTHVEGTHTSNRVEANKSGQAVHVVTLTSRWIDRSGAEGSLHAHVSLSEPWENYLPLPLRRRIHTLGQFHIVRGDRTRLVAPKAYGSALSCIHTLSKAARQLVFIDVMRVHPAYLAQAVIAFDGDPYKMLTSKYPNQDHESLWCDPATGLHFILNEPYQIDAENQAPVLAGRGMVAHATREWTIHNPEGTLAQLIAPAADSVLLEKLVKQARKLPERFNQIRFTDDTGTTQSLFQ